MQFQIVLAALQLAISARAVDAASRLSPDRALIAYVRTEKSGESLVFIDDSKGHRLFAKSFVSPDSEHGGRILKFDWTPNSRFFVVLLENSGGHSPMMHPIYYWDKRTRVFRSLAKSVSGVTQGFSITAPDVIHGKHLAIDVGEEDFSISLSKAIASEVPPNRSLDRPAAR